MVSALNPSLVTITVTVNQTVVIMGSDPVARPYTMDASSPKQLDGRWIYEVLGAATYGRLGAEN